MGEEDRNPKRTTTSSSRLAPGLTFFPSEEQMLCYYLPNKNLLTGAGESPRRGTNNLNSYDLLNELDLYSYEPFDLPESVCYAYGYRGRKRHWFCYRRVLKEEGEEVGERRSWRRVRVRGGFWRRSGRAREVVGSGGNSVVVGTRTRFVFYSGNSVKTDWVLYEYALLDHVKASFVLCRVFVKPQSGNSISENLLSSCAEESVSAVRHVGVQHDGFPTPSMVEARVCRDSSVGSIDLSGFPVRSHAQLHHLVPTRPVSAARFLSNELVGTSRLPGGNMRVDAEVSQQLQYILEGDFLELDDLVD